MAFEGGYCVYAHRFGNGITFVVGAYNVPIQSYYLIYLYISTVVRQLDIEHKKKPLLRIWRFAEAFYFIISMSNILQKEIAKCVFPPKGTDSLAENLETPLEYNGGQLYKSNNNLCISVDWLQVMTKGIIPQILVDDIQDSYQFDDVTLVLSQSLKNGTKHYKVGFDVLYGGELFGVLLLLPRSKVLADDSGSFQVNNHILYQRGYIVRLETIMHSLNIQINNITRLDIAVDGGELFDDWQKYEAGEYLISGRASTKVHRSGNRELKQFEVGTRSSDKMVVGYNKSKEMRNGKSKNKLYISEHWKRMNIDTTKDVHRLELRMKNKAVKSVVNFDLSKLEDAEYLAGLMRSQLENYFEYRIDNDKDTNKRRSEKIQPIDWTQLNYKEVNKQRTTKMANSVWSAQRYLTHGLREIHAGIKDNENLFSNEKWNELNETAFNYGLGEWWDRLNGIIQKRDKVIIAEMRYKHMEYQASGKTFSEY